MAITQTLTPFPTPHPDRDEDDSKEFSDHVDATLGHLNTHITELDTWTGQANDLAEAMNEEIYDRFRATSTTSQTIGIGSLQFTLVEDHRAFWTGSLVRIVSNADPTVNYMEGTVTAYDDETDSLTVNVTVTGGSGTYADWNFALVGSVDTTLIDANTARISQNQNNIILEAFRRMIGDSQAGADAFQDGWVDALIDDSNIDSGNSSNYLYDTDSNSCIAMEFVVSQTIANTSFLLGAVNSDDQRYQAQSFTLAETTNILYAAIYITNKANSPSPTITFKIETDNGGVPSGTLADANATKAVTCPGIDRWLGAEFDTQFSLSAGTYWLVLENDSSYSGNPQYWDIGGSNSDVYADGEHASSTDAGSSWTADSAHDLTFKIGTNGDMILTFDAYEAEDEPAKSKALFIMEDVDAATLNTDIKTWASLDDGANYEQIILEDVGDFEADQHIIVGTEALTDRNDQTTRLKITTHNNKKIKIHAVANLLELQ